jgi:drug/metabolite transporter (DMT)-like permease
MRGPRCPFPEIPPLSADRNAMLLALAAIFLLTVMDSLIKGLSARFNALEIMFFRHAAGIVFITGVFLWMRPGWPSLAQWRGHAARSMLMLASGLMFFHALGRIPLAELFVYTFTAPIFIALFGALLLRERLSSSTFIGLALGFGGILLIVLTDPRANLGGGSWDGLAAAALSPVTYALGMVLLRKQTGSEPVTRIVFIVSLVSAGVVTLAMLPAPPVPQGGDVWRAIAIGALGTAGNLMLAMAFARAEAAKVGIVEYTGLLWAAIIGYVFFAEVPRPVVWIGAALVIAGCFIVARGRPRAVAAASGA